MSDGDQVKRPNVLVFITDQQRYDHVGFMGNEVVRTPNLDSIADRGMVFDNSWVANPVCMPNRSTMMTGRMPSAHGVIFNDRSLESNASTFVRQLRSAGYNTGLLGKSHLQHGMSMNSVVASELGPVATELLAPGWNAYEDDHRYLDPDFEVPDDFYGFGHVRLSMDHGARMSGHHLRWALDKGASIDDVVIEQDGSSPAKRRSDRWWQIYDPPYGPELHSTQYVAEQTVEFVESSTAQGKPWFAWCSFPDPHHPMTAPGEYYDRHDPADMVLPASIDDPLDDAPKHLQFTAKRPAAKQAQYVTPFGVAGDYELVKEAIAATYGMIEFIDDAVGQVLEAVDRLGVAEETIVIFTSDHGDMMGEHGLMLKGFMPFTGTQHVANVMAVPGKAAGRSNSLASTIDLAPTILDLCGVAGYEGIQGSSLTGVLDDPTVAVHDYVLIEDDIAALGARGRVPSKTRTVVTTSGKYTRNDLGEEMLFNTVDDRDEMNNLASMDATFKSGMVEVLADALMWADDQARGAPNVHDGRHAPA